MRALFTVCAVLVLLICIKTFLQGTNLLPPFGGSEGEGNEGSDFECSS